jgi:NADPH-dependent curcumin reductase CurA
VPNTKNRQVLLAERPVAEVTEAHFRIVEAPLPTPNDGEVLVRNRFLSLDPYMRMRMSDAPSYAPSVAIGQVMVGGAVAEVIESRSPRLKAGDLITAATGWQLYAALPAERVRRIENPVAPLSVYLGVLGMPGVTAWVGLHLLGPLEPGQTLAVSAASGAVGSVVGQIARVRGAKTVGIAGGDEKCRYVERELGFTACVDYKSKSADLEAALRSAAAQGIDFDFENVGGKVFDSVLGVLNPFARIALCGQVSQYNAVAPYPMRNLRSLLVNRVRLQGFIVSDHMALWPQALADLTAWYTAGQLKYRETVAAGLDNAPQAFIALLRGDKIGKQVVRLDDE